MILRFVVFFFSLGILIFLICLPVGYIHLEPFEYTRKQKLRLGRLPSWRATNRQAAHWQPAGGQFAGKLPANNLPSNTSHTDDIAGWSQTRHMHSTWSGT